MRLRILTATLAIFSLGLWFARPVQAEEPTPGVARMSLINGEVSTMRGDTGEWVATTVNAPLVPGDSVSTGERSRAEVQLDYANIIRLDQRAQAKIADLNRSRILIQVASGLVDFTVLKGSQADVEIDTPNMAVHPQGPGSYRIQVNSAEDTQATVREGQAEVSTPQGSTTVQKNEAIYVRGTDNPEYRLAQAEPRDEWDQWNQDRDRGIEQAKSRNYTNQYYTGAEDLDRYGTWEQVPDYGYAWTPNVAPDWVPYYDGSWVWEPYWGWTWVSYEPWGWAPYHYGRWFWWGDRWRWWPGYVGAGFYPTWGPAWVSFLGFGFGGRGWGLGFGFGSIGWCPLGPFDDYHPWWGRGNTVNVVNITNLTNINNVGRVGTHTYVHGPGGGRYVTNLQAALTNGNIRHGITTVPTSAFANGQVFHRGKPVDLATLRSASVVQGKVPVVPTRQSLRPVDRPASRAAIPPHGATAEHFFTKQPTPPAPTPFKTQAAAIERMVQNSRPTASANTRAQLGGLAPNGRSSLPSPAARPGGTKTSPASVAGNRAGDQAPIRSIQNSGARSTTATTGRPAPSSVQRTEAGGWQRFGTARSATVAPNSSGRQGFMGNSGPSGQRYTAPRSGSSVAPRSGSEASGWRRFSAQPAPAERGSAYSTPRSAPASPGYNRFSPRSESSAPAMNGRWNAPAPRGGGEPSWRSGANGYGSYGRPPLELRKPIVNPGYSGSRGYWGGGNYGRSAPSGGNYGRSAPSGGGRGWSAPSGSGHGSPAPSGGGHSSSGSHSSGGHSRR